MRRKKLRKVRRERAVCNVKAAIGVGGRCTHTRKIELVYIEKGLYLTFQYLLTYIKRIDRLSSPSADKFYR